VADKTAHQAVILLQMLAVAEFSQQQQQAAFQPQSMPPWNKPTPWP
jgi:hypothetical protein